MRRARAAAAAFATSGPAAYATPEPLPEPPMRTTALLAMCLVALTACSQHTGGLDIAATRIADPDVQRIHARMLEAMGGARGWERARYFEFDFVPVRDGQPAGRWSHRWDRYTGDFRLSGTRAGEPLVVVTNVNAPETGRAWIAGQPAAGAQLDSLLSFAYARFINDSYWLIMPYKWTDPGVRLSYVGPVHEAGRDWQVVRLAFDQVGLTPQNEYLAYINPQTGLMERWYHFRQAGADPIIFDWIDWRPFGPILLSTDKPNPDRTGGIRFENVRVETSVPAGAFDP
jgi:hypothetical protein